MSEISQNWMWNASSMRQTGHFLAEEELTEPYTGGAGPKLLEECRTLGGCNTGEAKITGGYKLKARYIIHTVGPVYEEGNRKCPEQLYSCYYNSLELAKRYDIHSIAFSAISTGVYGYPAEEAAVIALRAISKWLSENEDYGMAVIISCFSERMHETYQNVVRALKNK